MILVNLEELWELQCTIREGERQSQRKRIVVDQIMTKIAQKYESQNVIDSLKFDQYRDAVNLSF